MFQFDSQNWQIHGGELEQLPHGVTKETAQHLKEVRYVTGCTSIYHPLNLLNPPPG